MYGVAFPEKDLLKEYQYRMEEAKKRDHRNVGTQQHLFYFSPLSPGSAFFQPSGAVIYNALVNVSLPTAAHLAGAADCSVSYCASTLALF